MTAKTEFLYITSRNVKAICLVGVQVGDIIVKPSSSARNLGVLIDDKLCMTQHVNAVCGNATHAIRFIGSIRHYLDQETAENPVHAYVTLRLDQCNSLLYRLPDIELMKSQRVQHT